MAQSAGTMLGPYRIVRLIGAGGMGEVYAATDTRLYRTVAVKVLPSELAADSDRLQRFEREARAVSSLNHPHIATLFDVGEQGGTHFLVMELVEGRTLADQLARGKLRVSVALEYAAQIADALDNAHRKGIIHRDLKPGNVMITSTGVKLLDFGLAKLAEDEHAGRGAQAVTDAREPITAEGAVLGTAQYMAPEQLEGEEVDARADIFSFGGVLYEMLSGKPPFEGNSAAGLTAAILRAEPPPLSAQGDVPAVLDHLVATCLAKNRNDRWQTAHDVSKQLEWIRSSLGSLSGVSVPAARPRGRKPLWIGAAVGVAILAAATFFYFRVPRPATPAQLMRFTVSFRDQVHYSIGEDFFRSASISPDGQRIVFTGADQVTGTASLYIRPIGSEQVTAVRGSEDGTEPFWSPDSKSVGFYAQHKVKIANLEEGTTRDLADAASTGGATWNGAGQILISLANPAPIMLVPAAGGAPTAVTTLESGDGDHDWPQFLDDGKHFLYAVRGATAFSNKVYLTSLGSSARTLLVEDVSAFAYAAPNHLLYLPRNGGKLLARTLDVAKSELTGPPVTLAENALAPFSASLTGALTYRTVPSTPNPLVWIRPDGTVIGDALPPGYYTDPVFSPDGTQVALATKDDANARYDVSILDLATGTLRKLTANTAGNRAPVWSPDGKSIVFLSFRPEAPGLYRKDASGVGAEELILRSKGVLWPYQWRRDHLLYFEGVSGSNDVWMMATNDFTKRTPLIETPYNDVDGAVSPDGKWLAYVSNETGRWEIYLTTFPPSATKIVVTTQGGCDPTWSPDGATLYYTRPSSAELLSMAVMNGDPPRFGSPRRIYGGPLEYPSDHSIDVDPKGDRLIVAPSFAVQGDLTVLVNWESMLAK
jgi:eukaryotic-like serine/threonine-protein kinase